ncbi:MAG: class I SAM-dependent methyltransferase [Bacteroidales bacterium]|nr:class I SAM-dependent methyltransferase [Bacteroidales bacterium]MDY6346903.1 class I SAM-dependent methyltransferase [Bacteroidales bacterium]
MNLSESLKDRYSRDDISAYNAQYLAQVIAFGPVIFQVARIMLKWGILEMIADEPLTIDEVAGRAGVSKYAAKCLLESSLTMSILKVNPDTGKFSLSKTGFFLLNDKSTRVNLDFNHDVNYIGLFNLEESLKEGRPAGLKHFGDWPTVYEGLSSLPAKVQDSWFAFDHYYSDCSFEEALEVVFSKPVRHLMDVGGNTGRWALQCVAHDPKVQVTIVDLPQQLQMMRQQTAGKPGAERIHGYPANLLNAESVFPSNVHFDAIWMSQFLDCFSEEEITGILKRAAKIMSEDTKLYIMETFWDRQRFDTSAFCLTQISLYFTAIANGNSKMYHSDDLVRLVQESGLSVETIHDNLGMGHSIMVCAK